jgi:hypothetical protein
LILGICGTINFGVALLFGTTAAINRALDQGLAPPDQAYTTAIAVLGFICSVLQLSGGIVGIQATADINRVLAVDPVIVKRSRIYLIIYIVIYGIDLLLYTISTSMATSSIKETFGDTLSRSQLFWAIYWTWVYWVIVALINFYFVFVVFSYMKTLELAAEGKLGSLPFVVKDQYPMANPAVANYGGNRPLMGQPQPQYQVPPTFYAAQGHPVHGQAQPMHFGAPTAGVEMSKV